MELITGGLILHNYIFVWNALDFYLNYLFSIDIKSYLVSNFLLISFFLFIASYYDLKFGIIPNKLSYAFIVYALIFNMVLSLFFNNFFIIAFSVFLTLFVSMISFILWYIGFWGGGDFKIFVALSLALSFLDYNFLNYFNIFTNTNYDFLTYFNIFTKSEYSFYNILISDLKLSISNQFIFYPKVFSMLFNAILIVFLILSLSLIYDILKNKKLKYYSILSILDFKSVFNQLTTKLINVNDLSEGMVLDRYYFNNPIIFNKINENNEKDINTNLNAYKEDEIYYFLSLNRIGLTKEDVEFINDLYKKNLIENPNFKIKNAIPFMPFLTLGYIGFLIFGDFSSIISNFIKILF